MTGLPYALVVHRACAEEIRKRARKNPVMQEALDKKIAQVLENPGRFKPLCAPLQNKKRVHIAGSFVLIYEIDEPNKTVVLLAFRHHDDAY